MFEYHFRCTNKESGKELVYTECRADAITNNKTQRSHETMREKVRLFTPKNPIKAKLVLGEKYLNPKSFNFRHSINNSTKLLISNKVNTDVTEKNIIFF